MIWQDFHVNTDATIYHTLVYFSIHDLNFIERALIESNYLKCRLFKKKKKAPKSYCYSDDKIHSMILKLIQCCYTGKEPSP